MRITSFLSDDQILSEIGLRIKTARVRSELTQAELAQKSGVAKSTIERSEKGESVQFLNLIKILRSLNQLNSLDVLLPSTEKTPMEYLLVHSSDKRQRVYSKKKTDTPFKWGDEK